MNAAQSTPEQASALQAQAREQQARARQERELARIRSIARKWDLSEEDMLRAKALLGGTDWPAHYRHGEYVKGIKALGIHARDGAERDRYARMLVQAQHQEQRQRALEQKNRRAQQIMQEDFRRACEREAERLDLQPDGEQP